jgi:uncharacterized protein YdhG (YjbR/CyaY superfamily)
MRESKTKPTTFDDCLAAIPAPQRAVLETLRQAIHAAAPGAEEYVGYGLPGFKLDGRPLVYLGAWKNHCALYAASPAVQQKFAEELKGYETSKGTIRFAVDRPLPASLVRKIVKARITENAAKIKAKSPKPKTVRQKLAKLKKTT